jgi:hypothetical protein
VATAKVTQHDAASVRALLGLPEIKQFIADLDELHWTGRNGFGSAVMVGAALVKAVYALPTWSRVARLIAEHDALRVAIGGAPSQWACYRFANKLSRYRPPRPKIHRMISGTSLRSHLARAIEPSTMVGSAIEPLTIRSGGIAAPVRLARPGGWLVSWTPPPCVRSKLARRP